MIRFLRAVAALALVVLVAGVGLGAPHAAAATSTDVEWGVKQSFRSYVTGPIAHGTITVAGGASTTAGGTFRFPGGRGSVRFQGHDGVLEMVLADPHVEVSGSTATLVVDVTSRPFTSTTAPPAAPVTHADVALATLALGGITPVTEGGATVYRAVPAALTSAGVTAFGGFYEAGAPLDPVTFTIAATGTSSTTTTTAARSSSTTTTVSTTTTSAPAATTPVPPPPPSAAVPAAAAAAPAPGGPTLAFTGGSVLVTTLALLLVAAGIAVMATTAVPTRVQRALSGDDAGGDHRR